ncbi:hypothetical protein EJ03DRAFT_390195 [Teratosphaeria nubilosa]|uniref:Nudix hydrolase domain-containing protein n=1 Tax=Teratosphaeria nubilosa TaxID=161662 RepID=A0A6G1L527_9PEZI|nr:hypothetical protein EJ03DRAFT_390195 [Teratosphaeria nubilosa]
MTTPRAASQSATSSHQSDFNIRLSQPPASYYKLHLPQDDQPHGYLIPSVVEHMPWTTDFAIDHQQRTVVLQDASNGSDTATTVNQAFARLINICVDNNIFSAICGRHSEPFAIPSARYPQPVYLERFAANLFGITCRGAHLVCYTMSTDEGMKLWIPRRAEHLFTYPGMLDATVAGGVKSGVPPFQTITEEADEEASLPADVVRKHAKSRGVISHMSLTGKGFSGEQGLVVPDYIYVYDMELPPDMIPKPHDDEVGSFTSMTVEEVKAALLREEFKPDSAAVIVDFFITHSVLTAENCPDFVEISMRLHRRLPFRTG